jgi:hypothetical protein
MKDEVCSWICSSKGGRRGAGSGRWRGVRGAERKRERVRGGKERRKLTGRERRKLIIGMLVHVCGD